MNNHPPNITDVSINTIQIAERRQTDPEKVEMYSESIQEIGLVQPIGLTSDRRLIYGMHRLEAYKLLGLTEIPAIIHEADDLHIELMEIDENLMRRSLKGIELCEALYRREEIYNKLHQTKGHGGDRKSSAAKSSGDNSNLISFNEAAAQKLGKSPRNIGLYRTAAKRIPHDLRKQLMNTDVGEKITELTKLSTLKEVDQKVVVKKLVDGAKTVVAAIKDIEGEVSPEMQKVLDSKTSKDATKGQSSEEAASQSDVKDEASAGELAKEVLSVEPQGTAVDSSESSGDLEVAIGDEAEPEDSHANGENLEGEQADLVAAQTAYDEFLRDMPSKICLMQEHLAHIVGGVLDPEAAVEVLEQVIEFSQIARETELEAVEQLAEHDTPSNN